MNDLLDQLDAPRASAWIADNEGDLIMGTVLNVDEYDAGYGPYRLYVIEVDEVRGGRVDDGPAPKPPCNLTLHAQATVLRNELDNKNVTTGWRIAARYDGQGVGKSGNEYARWSVAAERPTLVDQLDTADADLF